MGFNQRRRELICCSGSLQHVNAFQNIEPFACSIFIAITAFGKDKVRYKQKIPIRRRFPPLSRDLLSCKYGCDRMQTSSDVPNNSSFKVDAFHARILPQITPSVTEQSTYTRLQQRNTWALPKTRFANGQPVAISRCTGPRQMDTDYLNEGPRRVFEKDRSPDQGHQVTQLARNTSAWH